jgi:hypothetical protein
MVLPGGRKKFRDPGEEIKSSLRRKGVFNGLECENKTERPREI